jgi:hypothetical protein
MPDPETLERRPDFRDASLRASVWIGAVTALATEVLGLFHLLRRVPLTIAWLLMIFCAAQYLWRRVPNRGLFFARVRGHPLESAIALAIAWIVVLTGVTAVWSPPNSFDVLAYHMPRVVYWAQAHSVRFFATPYLNQIQFPPLSEYFMLHLYLVAGGDRFVNLVSWAAFALSIAGVSAIAANLGGGTRAQAFAALFCATLPSGVLLASSAGNDTMLALWLVCAAYFATLPNGPLLGLALGLAVLTKGTAYLFAPMIVGGMFLCDRAPERWRRWRFIPAWAIAGVLLLNAPLYTRNLALSGSPIGYDSPFGNGMYKYRNEPLGWKTTVSTALLNLSDQLGTSSPRWNQGVYELVMRIHRRLGIDPRDPVNAARMDHYGPPANTRHEADANNRWHLLLLAVSFTFGVWLAIRRRNSLWLIYGGSLICAYMLFCFFVRWYRWDARYLLALFVLAAPLGGAFLAALRPRWAPVILGLLLLDIVRLPVTENWLRPLKGPHNVFVTPRNQQYFADITQMANRASYLGAVDVIAHSGCPLVGIDISQNQLEYPFEALLRERVPGVRFVHTGVENGSARYADREAARPCVILCMDCAGNQQKMALYRDWGAPAEIGRFLLFGAPGSGRLLGSPPALPAAGRMAADTAFVRQASRHGSPAMILLYSSSGNARSVSLRTKPCEPAVRKIRAAASSSGNSPKTTASYCPIVR